MARNRQKAKERQARRKAQAQSGDGAGAPPAKPPRAKPRRPEREQPRRPEREAAQPPPEPESVEPRADEPEPESDVATPEPEPDFAAPEPDISGNGREDDAVVDAHLRAGAPPEDVGRSDEVLEYEQDLEAESDEEERDLVLDEDIAEDEVAAGPRGHRGTAERHAHRPRFIQFLFAVWAELQRVQWPDRQALTTLTGVVLGFVLIAGGYLGLLDAIFSRIIQAIL